MFTIIAHRRFGRFISGLKKRNKRFPHTPGRRVELATLLNSGTKSVHETTAPAGLRMTYIRKLDYISIPVAPTMVSVTYLNSTHNLILLWPTVLVFLFLFWRKFYLARDKRKVLILIFEMCKTWNKQIIINLSYFQLSRPSEIIKSYFVTIGGNIKIALMHKRKI